MHKLKYTLNESGFGTVTLDGKPIDVASLSVTHQAGEPNIVTMTIFAQVEGDIEVKELTTTDKGKLKNDPLQPTPSDVPQPRRPKLL